MKIIIVVLIFSVFLGGCVIREVEPLEMQAIRMQGQVTIFIHPSLPVRTRQELIALARKKPDQLLYGSGGVGSEGHLAAEKFSAANGISIRHVPYKDSQYLGPESGVDDLVAGSIQMIFSHGGRRTFKFLEQGRIRALDL